MKPSSKNGRDDFSRRPILLYNQTNINFNGLGSGIWLIVFLALVVGATGAIAVSDYLPQKWIVQVKQTVGLIGKKNLN